MALGWQEVATVATVLSAVSYLVWKLGFGGKRPKRGGPDVKLSALTRKAKGKPRP